MSSDTPAESLESSDAEKVNQALGALQQGDAEQAEKLLLEVIANTPDDYKMITKSNGRLAIRFWDNTSSNFAKAADAARLNR